MHSNHVRQEHNGQGVYAYTLAPRVTNVRRSQEQIYLIPRAILSDTVRRLKSSVFRNNNIIIVMVVENSAYSRHKRAFIFSIIHCYYRYPFPVPVCVKIIQKSDTAVVLFLKKNFQRNIGVPIPLFTPNALTDVLRTRFRTTH